MRILTALVLCLAVGLSAAQQGPRRGGEDHGPPHRMPPYVREAEVDVVAGRLTDHSVVLSLLRYGQAGTVRLSWQAEQGSAQTRSLTLVADQPQEVVLDGLRADAAYRWQLTDDKGKLLGEERFHTQRAPGRSFRFTVTADSHLDQNTDPATYRRTLANARADEADFHVDLGDTFMSEKHPDRASATAQYLAQRGYLGAIGVPLFFVVGNHDGEEVRQRRGDNLAVWANGMRKRYFPNPLPDAFYSGDAIPDPQAGLLQDYYAWTWGDALFIVLNPYWYAADRRSDEGWGLSLGKPQYDWLEHTLASSHARYKFVFVHQLVGGKGDQGRGGVEMAGFGEWGGRNADGSEGFAAHRPGWSEPIHALLKRHGVSVVLHGHDHLFAAQTLDGIVYQEVPQPGHPGGGAPRDAEAYGYRSGTILGDSGHMRFSVGPEGILAELVRSDPRRSAANGEVLHRYTVAPRP